MADFTEDIRSKQEQYKLINYHYWFLLLSKQAMLAGYFIVIAVHVSTCYCLIAQSGFLSSLTSFVMLINALLGIIFLVWNYNYETRINIIKNLVTNFGNEIDFLKSEINIRLFTKSLGNHHPRIHKTASSILISVVSIGSAGASVALFVLFTLPYIKQHL